MKKDINPYSTTNDNQKEKSAEVPIRRSTMNRRQFVGKTTASAIAFTILYSESQ